METKYIQIWTQEITDWKYVNVLGKHKMSGKERNSQKNMVKGLHKVFKVIVKKLKNAFTSLGELG